MSYSSYYASDDDISGLLFAGEIVPGDNTVNERQHQAIKDQVMRILHGEALGLKTTDDLDSDDYGVLRKWFVEIYRRILDNERPYLAPEELKSIRRKYKDIPMSWYNPGE